MFNIKFKVVEICGNGVTITHYLSGRRNDVKKDIESFKNESRRYQMFGKEGMIVWS